MGEVTRRATGESMREVWPTSRPLDETALAALYRMPPPERPSVRTNFVSTLDGSVQGPDGRSGTINTGTDIELFALQRALCDAVLVGAGTARTEGYRAVELSAAQHGARSAAGLTGVPPLVVVSRSLRLDPGITGDPDATAAGQVIVVAAAAGDAGRLTEAGVEVLRCPGRSGVDLRKALALLHDRGLTRVLCEGGPTLHRQLLADDLVGEVCLTLVGEMVAGLGARVTHGPAVSARFELAHLLVDGEGTLFGRWLARTA